MTEPLQLLPGQQAAMAFLEKTHRLMIDGRWVDAAYGRRFPVANPATEQVIATVAEGGAADIDLAVKAARRAFEGSWARTLPAERSKLLWRLADLVEANAAELAIIETLDNGKTLATAMRVDINEAIERLRYYGGWATKLVGHSLSAQGPEDWHAYTLREPVGVAGLITAWNFAMPQAVNKFAAALAAGCTVVIKPPENTPLATLRLAELALEAGFPEGVINVVTGYGPDAGAALAEHPDVDKISFTGSTATGKRIIAAAGGNLKRLVLELGGKSPCIIFPDADLDRAIPAAANSIFFNSGQVCTAGSRLFVHETIFDRVVEGICDHAARLRVGPGIEPESDIGPLISAKQLDRVLGLCGTAAVEARILRGGGRIDRPGYFMEPTVILDTTAEMAVRREEIFGPVLCAARFGGDDLDTIARLANDTAYGLAAYIWTRDLGTAHRMARKVRAGLVNVNGGRRDPTVPSGGHKQSGWGLESGPAGIEAFTEMKSVVMGL